MNEECLYYNQNGIIVRDSTEADIEYISRNMRQQDITEIWRSHHFIPYDALRTGYKYSDICLTVQKKCPIAMFGVRKVYGGKYGIVWLLATDEINDIKIRFLKNCRKFIDLMLTNYEWIENYVDADNRKSIEWLQFLGADIRPPVPYGIERKPFHYFLFRKK